MTPFSPLAMVAELTHRCPMSCPWCSNPLSLSRREDELTTGDWVGIFEQAAQAGVRHLSLSGGEPTLRADLVTLVVAARDLGLYTNLVTAGTNLPPRRLDELAMAGLDHVTLSLQGTTPSVADAVSGQAGSFARKLQVARDMDRAGIPLAIHVVLSRVNIRDLPAVLRISADLGARWLTLSWVQLHGWAARNGAALQPSAEEAEQARRIIADLRPRHLAQMAISLLPEPAPRTRPPLPGFIVTPTGQTVQCLSALGRAGAKCFNLRDLRLAEVLSDPAFHSCDGDLNGCSCHSQPAPDPPIRRRARSRRLEDPRPAPVGFLHMRGQEVAL